jgi:hypothetical protein
MPIISFVHMSRSDLADPPFNSLEFTQRLISLNSLSMTKIFIVSRKLATACLESTGTNCNRGEEQVHLFGRRGAGLDRAAGVFKTMGR